VKNRIETEEFIDVDLDEFEQEPKPRPASLSQKIHARLCSFADMVPGLLIRVVLVVVALGAVYFNGYATANRDFDRSVNQGWYIKNATKFDEAAKNIITPSGYPEKKEQNEVTK